MHLNDPIAVMDSGAGGLSVLSALRELLPQEDYLYFGDNANAPYGEKPLAEVRRLTFAAVEGLLSRKPKALVVACNTATSAAISALRETYPDLPIIGLEPALKPAVSQHPGGRILVMATPLTIREEKFIRLLGLYRRQAEILPLPCPGLAEYIEQGHLDDEILAAYLRNLFSPCLQAPLDGLVLGCTHYPLIIPALRRQLGDSLCFYEGGVGAAKETKRRLAEVALLKPENNKGKVEFTCSGDNAFLLALAKKLDLTN